MRSTLEFASRFAHLAYWLGPWSPRDRAPANVSRRPITDSIGEAVGWLYTPVSKPIRDAWLISPGLHYDGPDDPRMHRLATVLSSAGYAVLSPAIHDLMRLQMRRRAIHDLTRAFDSLVAQPDIPFGVRPGVLGISVGSLAAIRLAASRPYRTRVSRVVTVGAYADPRQLLRSLTGALHRDNPRQPWDPRHQPLGFLTLRDHLPIRATDPDAVSDAWRRFVHATWPHAELRALGSHRRTEIAHALANTLSQQDRHLFLVGCGVRSGGLEMLERALAAPGSPYGYLDPREDADRLHAPLHLVHGVADPVIAFSQLAALKAAAPRSRAYAVSGWAHSEPAMGGLLDILPALPAELRTAAHALRALC